MKIQKKMKISRPLLLFMLTAFCTLVVNAQITTKPTFECCGFYIPHKSEAECKVSYKKNSEKTWNEALAPIYDKDKKEFRGSIVRLSENTAYDIKAEIFVKGEKEKSYQAEFTTWNPNPQIAKVIKLSEFKEKDQETFLIHSVIGNDDGWIKIVGDCDVQAIDTKNEAAIKFMNSRYVILEGIKVAGGYKHGILVPEGNSHIRIINCDISKWGRASKTQRKDGVYIDEDGRKINFDGGIKIDRSGNIVVERCYIHDPKAKTNPWTGVVEDGPHKGREYPWTHPEGPTGLFVMQAKGGIVVRYNDIIGGQVHRFNDPLETAQNGYIDGGFNRDSDIYGNVLAFGQDDGIELDGGQCNVRMFDNRIEQTFCGISTAANTTGPSYIFNNVVWNLGNVYGVQSVSVKNGGGPTYSRGKQHFFHNTMIVVRNGITGVGFGNDEKREQYIAMSRNNILVSGTLPDEKKTKDVRGVGMSVSDAHKSPWNDFDYDMLGNTATTDGKGAFKAKAGSEANAVFALPHFNDLEHGVFTLKPSDPGIGRGCVVPNFSDGFTGQAPDMGAFRQGVSSLFPMRPMDITADKYYVKLTHGQPQTVTLHIGDIKQKGFISIRQCEDMDWLTVKASSKKLQPHSTITLTLTSRKTNTPLKQIGMFTVRLEDGFSVPITVLSE